MPSFDITSKVDLQTLDNAVNTVNKEIQNRFDFKNSHVKIELNKKDYKIDVEAESEMKMDQITDVMLSRSMKQGIPPEAFDFSKDEVIAFRINQPAVGCFIVVCVLTIIISFNIT